MTQQAYVMYCVKCKKSVAPAGIYCTDGTSGRDLAYAHIIQIHIFPYLDENTERRVTDFKVFWNYWCEFIEGRPKK